MDNKALFKLTYGVFVLGTTAGDKMNACITNTAMQVASNPDRIAICCINANYTCDLIKESGTFALTLLDQTCTFETIQHFGFQSGRDVDKFADLTPQIDSLGNPYLGYQACAVISGKVVDSLDLGSHTMFIAEVLAINVDDKYIDKNGAFDISKCNLITYSNGGYYSLGKKIGKFGYSVAKKKKKRKNTNKSGKNC